MNLMESSGWRLFALWDYMNINTDFLQTEAWGTILAA